MAEIPDDVLENVLRDAQTGGIGMMRTNPDGTSERIDPKDWRAPVLIEPIPIEIRPDVVVHVAGVPVDITPEEADKIGRVVRAYAIREQKP